MYHPRSLGGIVGAFAFGYLCWRLARRRSNRRIVKCHREPPPLHRSSKRYVLRIIVQAVQFNSNFDATFNANEARIECRLLQERIKGNDQVGRLMSFSAGMPKRTSAPDCSSP